MENNSSKILQEFLALSKFKKIIIIGILLVCLGVGIAIPSFIQKSNRVPNKTGSIEVLSPTPSISVQTPASLKLTSSKSAYKIGDFAVISIDLDSGSYGVGAADFVVHFDPKILKPILITPGNYFKTIANTSIQENTIKISALAEVTDTGITFPNGKGTVATIQFETLSATDKTGITFDTEKTIVASDGRNILEKVEDLTLSISE